MTDGNPGPRSRDLFRALEVAALVVAGVLIVAWVTDLVPVLRDSLSLAPLIIIGLVADESGSLRGTTGPRPAPG